MRTGWTDPAGTLREALREDDQGRSGGQDRPLGPPDGTNCVPGGPQAEGHQREPVRHRQGPSRGREGDRAVRDRGDSALMRTALARRNGVRFVLALAVGTRKGETLGFRDRLNTNTKILRVSKQRRVRITSTVALNRYGAPTGTRPEPCKPDCTRHKKCPPLCPADCTGHARYARTVRPALSLSQMSLCRLTSALRYSGTIRFMTAFGHFVD